MVANKAQHDNNITHWLVICERLLGMCKIRGEKRL